ncbi:hypothetical protein [Streptomyces sp. NPDC002491]
MSVTANLLSANVESVETDTSGWTAGANTTLFSSTRFYSGVKSLGMTATAAGSVTATTATRVAVTAGTVYQAYAYFAGITAIAGRTSAVRVDWWAASTGGTAISSSTGAATTLTNDTAWNTPPPQLTATAPAGALYASVTVTVTGLTAGAQVATDRITFGLPTNISLNVLPYTASSVETDASEWTALTGCTVGRNQPLAFEGWYHLLTTSTGAGAVEVQSIAGAVTPGLTYMAQILGQSASGRPITVKLRWFDASGTEISTRTGNPWSLNTSGWTVCNTVGIAPPTAATVRMVITATATSAGQTWMTDSMRINLVSGSIAPGNLIPFSQSDFEGGIDGWTVTGGTASTTTAVVYNGVYAMGVVAAGGDLTISASVTPTSPIIPGESYAVRIPQNTPGLTPNFKVLIEWCDATGSAVRTRWQTWGSAGVTGWYWAPVGDVAPAGAVSVRISLVFPGLTSGDAVYIDRAQFALGGLTVTATPVLGGGAQLRVNGLTSRGPTWLWTLDRVDASGSSYPVRGWTDDLTAQPITGDVAVITDYEAPLGVPVQWRVTLKNPAGAGYQDYLSDALTLDYSVTEVWLKDPGLPQRNVRAVVQTPMPTWKRPARQGVNVVQGRRLPVVISDVRGGKVGDLTVVTESTADKRALDWVLDSGGPLLLQWPPGWGEDDIYVSVGEISAAPVVDYAEFSDRTWILPLTEVDRPIGGVSGSADRTWTTVAGEGDSWADVLDGVTSWLTVRIGA